MLGNSCYVLEKRNKVVMYKYWEIHVQDGVNEKEGGGYWEF